MFCQPNNKEILRKTAVATLSAVVFILCFYYTSMPTLIKAYNNSQTFNVSVAVTTEIDISAPGNVTMTPTIAGMSGNYGNPASGSATFTVTATETGGFDLKIFASQTNALYLDGSSYFSDYAPTLAGTPDYSWRSPATSDGWFGYSITAGTAADADQKYKYSGTDCGVGSSQSGSFCWMGFTTTPGNRVIHRTTATGAGGEVETINFRAESNAKFLKEGTYSASVTATASMN